MSLENKFNCPVCSNTSNGTLIDFGNVPQSGIFLYKPEEQFPLVKLKFNFCKKCFLIYLDQTGFELHNYSIVNRKTSHQLPKYSNKIIRTLKEILNDNDLIIEVGSNDGTFLDILKKEGFTNLLGIEPSIKCAEIISSKGHNVENSYLNKKESYKITKKYGTAKAVLSRHTIEHTHNPKEFLESIKLLLQKKGVTFIETPNSYEILQKLFGHELWDEHLFYFSQKNLELLANNIGFKISKTLVYPHLMGSNLLLFASNDLNNRKKYSNMIIPNNLEKCENFFLRWTDFCDKLHSEIENCPKPIFGIGASHPQTNFFIFSGIGNYIDNLIDDDPNKTGKYSPLPNPTKIISTEEFMGGKKPGTLILTAFGYGKWMKQLCTEFNGVKIINPYSF